jgi:hypothetical protein
MDKMPNPRPAGGTREALPSLAQHLMKTYGSFVPGDISVRLNFAESVFTDPSHPDHPIARTTWIHESHHYKLMVGTTWGLTHLRYTRSWANLGVVLLAEQIVPAFRERGELVPYPLQRFCATHASHPLAPFVLDVMRPFSEYTDSLYYELGLVPSFTANGKTIPLPSLSVDENFSVPFGVWWLLETAARVEDRWRNKNDFTERDGDSCLSTISSGDGPRASDCRARYTCCRRSTSHSIPSCRTTISLPRFPCQTDLRMFGSN